MAAGINLSALTIREILRALDERILHLEKSRRVRIGDWTITQNGLGQLILSNSRTGQAPVIIAVPTSPPP